jgi:transcriptional regulator
MYVPGRFAETDRAALQSFVAAHSFATLVTSPLAASGAAVPFASHLPLLLAPERGAHGALRGHMARANPQWRHFAEGAEVLAIFSGPHAFVSSMWSAEPTAAVPTWNYVAVHVYGHPRLLEAESEALGVLGELMARYQPEDSPLPLDPPAPLAQKLVQAIVAFEIEITRWEGKSKLSQNRTTEDRRRIEDALRGGAGVWDGDIAERMQRLRESGHG